MTMAQNPRTITAANSIVLFSTENYFSSPVQLQGFQADNAFGFGDATMGETRIGVDGLQSGGWVSHEVPFTIYLEANSESRIQMEEFRAYCNGRKETERVTFDVTMPSTGQRVVASGFMVSHSGGTSAQKMLQGSQYVFNLVINGEEGI